MDVGVIVEALGLDPARIVAKAGATEDYARLLTERAAEDPAAADAWRVRAAGAHTIAGSFWMLVRPREALAPLGQAEKLHDAIGSAYGSLLSICAHPRLPAPAPPLPRSVWEGSRAERPDDAESPFEPEPTVARLQPAASLLAHLWPLAAGETDQSLEQLLSDTPLLGALPGSWLTGRLRIPLAHYRGVAREIDLLRHDERPVQGSRLPATRAFLDRAVEAIDAARGDEHHWRALRSPILPAEPEVMAACVLIEMTARDALGVSAIEVMDVPSLSLADALMGVAQNLLEADASATPERAS